MTFKRHPHLRRAAAGGAMLLAATMAATAAGQDLAVIMGQPSGIPQVPAFLPNRYSVAKSEPLPIDGMWLVNTLRKKIRIEAGRAYAVDSWLHLFVLKVQPDMVVIRDFQRTGPGRYTAQDLPLMGPATMQLNADGNLAVTVQGMLGPVRYELRRLEARYPEALSAEISAAGHAPSMPPPPTPPPATTPGPLPGMPETPQPVPPLPGSGPAPVVTPERPADCKAIGVDPDTGVTICA